MSSQTHRGLLNNFQRASVGKAATGKFATAGIVSNQVSLTHVSIAQKIERAIELSGQKPGHAFLCAH